MELCTRVEIPTQTILGRWSSLHTFCSIKLKGGILCAALYLSCSSGCWNFLFVSTYTLTEENSSRKTSVDYLLSLAGVLSFSGGMPPFWPFLFYFTLSSLVTRVFGESIIMTKVLCVLGLALALAFFVAS